MTPGNQQTASDIVAMLHCQVDRLGDRDYGLDSLLNIVGSRNKLPILEH